MIKKPIFCDKLDSFIEEYKCFLNQNNGLYPDGELLFNLVEDSHDKIRQLIGGSSLSVNVESSQNEEIANKDQIVAYITKFISGFSTPKDFLENVERFYPRVIKKLEDCAFKTLRIDAHRTVRSVDLIVDFCSRIHDFSNKRSQFELNKFKSVLANMQTDGMTTKFKHEVIIDTTAMAFVNLGHYGPDIKSCFRQLGGSANDKYAIGVIENSFVVVVKNNSGRIVARGWGVFYKGNWYTFNYYFDKSVKHTYNIFVAIKEALSYLTKQEHNICTVFPDINFDNLSDLVFINDSFRVCYQSCDLCEIDEIAMRRCAKINSENWTFECPRCGKEINDTLMSVKDIIRESYDDEIERSIRVCDSCEY